MLCTHGFRRCTAKNHHPAAARAATLDALAVLADVAATSLGANRAVDEVHRDATGELSVIRDSDYQNWTGVEAFFAKGLTFSARPVGAYGSPVIVELEANGRAVWREQVYDAKTGEISMRAVPARYTVASSSGRASGAS